MDKGRWSRLRVGRRLAGAAVVLVLAGCSSGAPLEAVVQPREGRAGLQVSGRLRGAQLALSDGSPRLVLGDCDPVAGADRDVCAITNDINGELFVLVFENPDVLRSGATLPVDDPGCGDDCDDVTDVAVVDVQQGTAERIRAVGGSVRLDEVVPLLRYVGAADLQLPDGAVQADFDLVPSDD